MNHKPNPPLLTLAPHILLREVTADYVHAERMQAALHSFVLENEARMADMEAAHRQIEQQLQKLELTRHLVCQEETTAEITALVTGTNETNRGRRP
jgi:F-type H+-transporting ATPase subunit gamma